MGYKGIVFVNKRGQVIGRKQVAADQTLQSKLKKALCLTPQCCQTHGKGHCYCENCKKIDEVYKNAR